MDLPEIKSRLRELLPKLRSEYAVESLGVFGSYVRNEHSPESDLDLLVTFRKIPGLFAYSSLENWLSDELGVKVDLVHRPNLKPNIGKRILQEVEMV